MKYKGKTRLEIIAAYNVVYFLVYGELIYCAFKKAVVLSGMDNFSLFITCVVPLLPGLIYYVLRNRNCVLRKRRLWKFVGGLNSLQLIIMATMFYDFNRYVVPEKIIKNMIFNAGVLLTFIFLFIGYYYKEICKE